MKRFTFKSKDSRGEATIIFNGENLEEIVAEFENFLRASGFDLGDNQFALINFNEMEMLDEGLFEDDEDGDKGSGSGSGNGSGNTSH